MLTLALFQWNISVPLAFVTWTWEWQGMAVTVLYIIPNAALGKPVLTGAAENKVSLHVGQGGSW